MASTAPSVSIASPVVSPVVYTYTRSPLAMGILLFMVLFSFIWIFLYAFKPSFVCVTGDDGKVIMEPFHADSAKCVFGSLIISLLVLIVLWMFKS